MQVLNDRNFLSSRGTVELKGRVACEIHSHEVLLTELIFQNAFSEYEPAEIAALLSCFVFQQVNRLRIVVISCSVADIPIPRVPFIILCVQNICNSLFFQSKCSEPNLTEGLQRVRFQYNHNPRYACHIMTCASSSQFLSDAVASNGVQLVPSCHKCWGWGELTAL